MYVQRPVLSMQDHNILRLIFMYHATQILVSNDFTDCIQNEDKDTEIAADANVEESMDTTTAAPVGTDGSQGASSFVSRKACIFGEVWRIAKKESMPWNEMKKIDCDAVWKKICDAS
jgi:hypothetical protein